MTRCKEFYKLWDENNKKDFCKNACRSTKIQIRNYMDSIATIVTMGADKDSVYCLYSEAAAREIWREKSKELRQELIVWVAERVKSKVDTDFKDVQQKRKELNDERRELEHKARTSDETPPEKYRVVYADPPWKYGNEYMDGWSSSKAYGPSEGKYTSLSIEELCGLPILDMVEDDAVLFLWVTSPFLKKCFAVIEAWGFDYKASFIWDKVGHNFGHYNSVRHEFLLICGRGKATPDKLKLFDSVQVIEKSEIHSEKPEQFREIIDTLYTKGNRIELFARKEVEGWDRWPE